MPWFIRKTDGGLAFEDTLRRLVDHRRFRMVTN